MSRNKSKQARRAEEFKQKRRKGNLLEFAKDVLTLLGGLVGSILAVYGLVKTFKDDAEGFVWLIPVGIIIWLILLWQLFQFRKMMAYSLFIISVLLGVVEWIGWQSQVVATEEKVIVLVAPFDGPEETYGLRRQMMEDLREATKGYGDTAIIEGDSLVTSTEYAREVGEQEKADLVIWAWYRPIENPNITIHIENLSPKQIEVLEESETYHPQSTLAQLESFEIQRKLGSETSTLISFLTGMLSYKSGDYQTATERFEQILEKNDVSTFIRRYDLFFNLGYSNYELGNYERSLQYSNKVIEIDPQAAAAYNNRGTAYFALEEYDLAFQDFDKATDLDPQYAHAFNNRGAIYSIYEEYDLALRDFNRAIKIDPQFGEAYYNRGKNYADLVPYQ